KIAQAVEHALTALLEGPRLTDERLVPPPGICLELNPHLLRRLASGAGLLFGVGEELARLLLGFAASLGAVGVDRGADIACVIVGLEAHARGFAGELFDAGRSIGFRVAENFVGIAPSLGANRLGSVLGRVQNTGDVAARLSMVHAAVRGFLV